MVIVLPEFVKNFSEGMISEETNEFLDEILIKWFEEKLFDIYIKNQNVGYQHLNKDQTSRNLKRLFESFQENITALNSRLLEKYGINKF